MKMVRMIAAGAAALTLVVAALPVAAQTYYGDRSYDRYDRRNDDPAIRLERPKGIPAPEAEHRIRDRKQRDCLIRSIAEIRVNERAPDTAAAELRIHPP